MRYFIYIITFILIVLFLRDIDYDLLFQQVDRLGYRIFGVIAISFIAYLFGSLAWMFSINSAVDMQHFGKFFIVRQIGEVLSIMNPTGIIAGDALKIHLMSRVGYDKGEISRSVIISRILTWLSYLLLVLFVFIFFINDFFASRLLPIFLFAILICSAILLFMLLFHDRLWMYKAASGLFRMTNLKFLKKKLPQIKIYNQEIYKLKKDRPSYVVIVIILFVIHYLAGALEYYYILSLLDIHISFVSAISIEIGTSFLRSIFSFIPGQMGIEEYGNKYFLSLAKVHDEGVWVTVSILRRLRQVWWIVFGIISYTYVMRSQLIESNNKLKLSIDGDTIY